MTRREALQTETMLQRLANLLATAAGDNWTRCREDAESLRRISMTLHHWHELECGTDGGCIERGILGPRPLWGEAKFESNENGHPYWANHGSVKTVYHKIPDREAGALKRLAAIMARYPSLSAYVQGDPRGAALYILRSGDVPAGEKAESYYSRGLAVHQ